MNNTHVAESCLEKLQPDSWKSEPEQKSIEQLKGLRNLFLAHEALTYSQGSSIEHTQQALTYNGPPLHLAANKNSSWHQTSKEGCPYVSGS